MNISVTTMPNYNEKLPFIKAYAKIEFNNQYCINNLTIREKKSGELYVKMPQALRAETNQNGTKERVYKDIVYPKTADLREQISAAVIHTYNSCGIGKKYFAADIDMEINSITPSVFKDKTGTIGSLRVDMGDFVIPNFYVQRTANGFERVNCSSSERLFKYEDGSTKTKSVQAFVFLKEEEYDLFCQKAMGIFHEKENEIKGINPINLTDLTNSKRQSRK